jgi:acetyl-CoA carboxylase biotin carboxyl carrier protein
MESRDIKALLVLMQDYGLVELEIEDKKGKVRLVRGSNSRQAFAAPDAWGARTEPPAPTPSASAAKKINVPAPNPSDGATNDVDLKPNQKLIASPMVGTFYRASAPNSDPFIEEGDTVRRGQPLCIIEAMKMMNEIEADSAGRVVRILCDNGQPVEYGQPLIIIETA